MVARGNCLRILQDNWHRRAATELQRCIANSPGDKAVKASERLRKYVVTGLWASAQPLSPQNEPLNVSLLHLTLPCSQILLLLPSLSQRTHRT